MIFPTHAGKVIWYMMKISIPEENTQITVAIMREDLRKVYQNVYHDFLRMSRVIIVTRSAQSPICPKLPKRPKNPEKPHCTKNQSTERVMVIMRKRLDIIRYIVLRGCEEEIFYLCLFFIDFFSNVFLTFFGSPSWSSSSPKYSSFAPHFSCDLYILFRERISISIGVPSNPKISRILFSIYRI